VVDEREQQGPATPSGKEPLTPEQAREAFDDLAARTDEIAFGYLAEGCECRAQLMIERLQARALIPGRAWAVAVGRLLAFPHPSNPKQTYKWRNHVAPTLAVAGAEHGVLVLDPSLSRVGPLTLLEWAQAMRARKVEVSLVGLTQAEILSRQAARALQGEDLDAVVFCLPLGQPPLVDVGGTGFRIGADPDDGPGAFARSMMPRFLERQKQVRP
jgi:hypothetical protein